jgi:hypothetical protein
MEDVRIHLEIEGMRYAVIHAFAAHQGVIREIVDERLAAALDNWRIDNEVDTAIQAALNNTVQGIIHDEVKALLNSIDVRSALQVAVATAFTEALQARGLLSNDEMGQ